MFDVKENLEKGIKIQKIDIETKNIPFNIYMKNNGDILRLCFLEAESKDTIIVSETTSRGTEEIRIIPKVNIEYISIFYDWTSLEPRQIDKMII